MAKVSWDLIQALKSTSMKIDESNNYQWGHMGLCNCGFLAQEVTKLSKSEIHSRAMERHGDWSEQLNDYCPTSGLAMDDLITNLVDFGFSLDELRHLERLSHPEVLARIPFEKRNLKHNIKEDVVIYFKYWIEMLEEQLIRDIHLPELTLKKEHYNI
jgi:hypothetical protein